MNQVFPPVFEYHKEQLKRVNIKLNNLLKRLIKYNNIRTFDGSLAHVTSHQFRHTYGTVANRMGKRPDQIKYGLRHVNLDMQDVYVEVTPQEQEKNIQRILINKDGQQIIYKTDRDREVIRREWQVRQIELGLCGRPNILKDCQDEYICLGCQYAYYSSEHLSQLLELRKNSQNLLDKANGIGQSDSRRAHSARQHIEILNRIISELQKDVKEEMEL
jgi:hypothetical protein